MNIKLVVIGLLIALTGMGLLVFFNQQPDAPTAAIIMTADLTDSVQFYKQLYPDAIAVLRKEGCIDGYLDYLKSTDIMRVNRNKVSCQPTDNYDWAVEYESNKSGLESPIPALVIALNRKGETLESIFTSPFDDVYLILYDGIYGPEFLRGLDNDKINVGNAWGLFEINDIAYTFIVSNFPERKQTGIELYIEKYSGYKLSKPETLKQDIRESHMLLRKGAEEVTKALRDNLNITPVEFYYAVYP